MRNLLRTAPIAAALVLVACSGAGRSVRKPSWVSSSSGTVDDDGRWYWQIERVDSGTGLQRRRAVDNKVREALVAVCKDVKPEEAQVVDHYVDADTGSETAIARIDAARCPDAPKANAEGGGEGASSDNAAAAPAQPAEGAAPAEQPAEGAAPAEQPAEGAAPAEQPAEGAAPAEQPAEGAAPQEEKQQ
jgi:hypothetical protein